MKPEVVIRLKVKGVEIELTPQEAKELGEVLRGFGDPVYVPVQVYPSYPSWPYQPYWYCTSGNVSVSVT